MAKNAYSTTAPTKVSKDATLPVRGTVAELKLEKKLPKKIDAIIVAIFEGEDSIELAGGEVLDFIFSTEQQADILTQLEAVGAKATANSITRVPGTDRRVKLLELTPEGRRTRDAFMRAVAALSLATLAEFDAATA